MRGIVKKLNAKYLLLTVAVFFLLPTGVAAESVTVNATVSGVCGNSILESGESCDDGNTTSLDGCSSACQTESGGGGPPNPVPIIACVPNGSCSAVAPACGQTTNGVDNCGNACTKTGVACQCVSDGSCTAAEPICGETTAGVDNCGVACFKTGIACACVPVDGSCNAPEPTCDQTTTIGKDNCDNECSRSRAKCACVSDGSCSALVAACGEITTGVDNCGNNCARIGKACDNRTDGGGSGWPFSWGGGFITNTAQFVSTTIEAIKTEIIAPIKEMSAIIATNVGIITADVKSAVKATDAGIRKTIKRARILADNPQVEEATKKIAAPTTVAVSIAVAAPSLWSIIFPLTRFLFLQPILLLGLRKRKEWGEIYNSLTKLPLDLVTIKLLDAVSGKVIQSRVTDTKGRYLLSVRPGSYRLEIIKNNFAFPSSLLKEATSDGARVDLYHGEVINVTENEATITANVPVDPIGAEKTPRRIIWERRLRVVQHTVSIIGIVLTAAYVYITPTWFVIVFLGIHVAMYAIFYFLATPRRPKGWGIVHDEMEKNPVGRAVARLFSKQYHKLVATEITDSKGRYAFLAGPNDYYVKVEKTGYQSSTKEITIAENDPYIVKEDLTIKKGNDEPTYTLPPK